MARMKEIVDLVYTESGDFFLGKNGDLADTKLDLYKGFIQRVHTRMSSGKGDWLTEPEVGVGLTTFVGKQNTAKVAEAIKRKVYSELLQDDLLRPAELVVDVLPVTEHEIAIALIITPPRSRQQLTLMYTYSVADNKVHLRSV